MLSIMDRIPIKTKVLVAVSLTFASSFAPLYWASSVVPPTASPLATAIITKIIGNVIVGAASAVLPTLPSQNASAKL
ncbi:hypothetical protein ES703_22427 [subsurface metagenome]